MAKVTLEGWQKSVENAAQPTTGIILGSRIRKRIEREKAEAEFYARFGDGPVAWYRPSPKRPEQK
jgi:hypothetical protein